MRSREPESVVIESVAAVAVKDSQIELLQAELKKAADKINKLETALIKVAAPDDRAWTFDVKRNNNGRITEVIAHKQDVMHSVM